MAAFIYLFLFFLTTGIATISPSGTAFITKDTEDVLPFTAQVEKEITAEIRDKERLEK